MQTSAPAAAARPTMSPAQAVAFEAHTLAIHQVDADYKASLLGELHAGRGRVFVSFLHGGALVAGRKIAAPHVAAFRRGA